MTHPADTEMGRHLRDMHGKDITGIYRHDPQRDLTTSPEWLSQEHDQDHEDGFGNEASTPHTHGSGRDVHQLSGRQGM